MGLDGAGAGGLSDHHHIAPLTDLLLRTPYAMATVDSESDRPPLIPGNMQYQYFDELQIVPTTYLCHALSLEIDRPFPPGLPCFFDADHENPNCHDSILVSQLGSTT